VWRNWHGEPAASLGVVGAIGGPVRIGRRAAIDRIIRADIGSTRGISGSPLVNAEGQIVGVLNAGVARGVPLALPIDEVERSVQALAVHGRIRRGFLGLALQPVALPARQHANGDALLVVAVEAGGPADKAGLLVGDIVVAAGGAPTPELDALHRWLGGDRIGSTLEIDVLRGTAVERIGLVVGERGASAR
jgi:S1-C subfamily serine protease